MKDGLYLAHVSFWGKSCQTGQVLLGPLEWKQLLKSVVPAHLFCEPVSLLDMVIIGLKIRTCLVIEKASFDCSFSVHLLPNTKPGHVSTFPLRLIRENHDT